MLYFHVMKTHFFFSDKNGAYDYVKATEERVSDVCEEPRPSPDGNDSSSEELGKQKKHIVRIIMLNAL